MRYLSLFSGIEAATVAWHGLGWEPVAFAEVDAFPPKVLTHHWPDIPNLGDVTQITGDDISALGPIDLVVGGSPCQDLSVAGKREGLAGARSNLFYEQMRIFHEARKRCGARWLLWENVPGAFSTNKGADFGCVVGAMAGAEPFERPQYGWGKTGVAAGENGLVEWCVLDAQWFGVPQRRRRVFALLDTGDWANRPPILFDSESLCRDTPTRRKTGEEITDTLSGCTKGGGGLGTDFECSGGVIAQQTAPTLQAGGNNTGGTRPPGTGQETAESLIVFEPRYARNGRGAPDTVCPPLKAQSGQTGKGDAAPVVAFQSKASAHQSLNPSEIAPTLDACKSDGLAIAFKPSHYTRGKDGAPILFEPAVAIQGNMVDRETNQNGRGYMEDMCPTLNTQDRHAVAFKPSHFTRGKDGAPNEITPPLSADADKGDQDTVIQSGYHVRRLTPRECERLQGFPDDHTNVPGASDSARYKALGNSMAVPVMRWIGEQIETAEMLSA